MQSNKSNFLIILIVAGFILCLLPIFNICTDFSRVLNKDYSYNYLNNFENLSYLKISYLLENPDDFDSLIFGSSRVRVGFNTDTLRQKLGGNWFKVEYPGGNPVQHLHNLKALLYYGYRPRQIILTVNDFDLWSHPLIEKLNSRYNRRLYPISLREWIDFYKFYLYKKPTRQEKLIVAGKLELKKYYRIIKENRGIGKIIPPKRISDHTKRLQALPPYQKNAANKNYNYGKTIKLISDIKSLTDSQKIKLYIIYLPSTPKTFLAKNYSDIQSFKIQLSVITDFYDFSGIHDISSDLSNWNEMSHFKPNLGDEMIKSITDSTVESGDFGFLITKSNIKTHLFHQKQKNLEKIPEIMASRKDLLISDSFSKEIKVYYLSGGLKVN